MSSTDKFDGERVAVGRYRYGEVWNEIEVLRYPFDYWVELLELDVLERRPAHDLNWDGFLFYVVPAETDPLPDPFQSSEAAMAWADQQPWGPVEWQVVA